MGKIVAMAERWNHMTPAALAQAKHPPWHRTDVGHESAGVTR